MRTDVRDEELEKLAFCRHLKQIDLTGSAVTNRVFFELAKLPRLQWLDLTDNEITGIPKVNGFPSLTRLVLDDCKIDDAGLRGLTQFPKLESLRLNEKSVVTDECLKTLSKVRTLRSATLGNNNLAGLQLDQLNGSKNLEYLNFEVENWASDSVRQPISASSRKLHKTVLNDLPKLRTLDLWLYPNIESFNLIDLPALTTAEVFFRSCPHQATRKTPYRMCDYCKQRTKLVKLENVPKLHKLRIGYAGRVQISNAPSLEYLELYGARHFLKSVRTLPKLRSLKIQESKPLSLADLKKLGSLPNLESLTLNWEKISDETMKVLSNFPNLKKLNIENGIIHAEGISRICKLQNLEELSFDWVNTKDNELDPLQKLTQLKKLTLRGSIGELNLSGLEKLEKLDIDADVKSLNLSNLPLLESIWIYDYKDVESISLRNLANLKTFRKNYDDNSLSFLHLEALPNLTRLELDHKNPNPNLRTESLANLRDSPMLSALLLKNLTIGEMTLDSINCLERLRKLRAIPRPGMEEQFKAAKEKIEKQYFSIEDPEGMGN